MIRRLLWLLLIALLAGVLLYVSRFWGFQFWGREGLFGISTLRPQGGLLSQALRGTPLAPFELLIWVVGVFLILTGLQNIYDRLTRK